MSAFFADTSALAKRYLGVDHHQLRALDAIQLACAVQARQNLSQPITFVSADNNLLKAAGTEGFSTDNPNHYH